MGWYVNMTPEELEAEFGSGSGSGGASCSISNKPSSLAATTTSADKKPSAATAALSATNSKTTTTTTKDETANDSKPKAATTKTSSTSSGNTACPLPKDTSAPPPPPPDVDYIYHLCQVSKWNEAKSNNQPYFPPTFMTDGKFTRASVDRDDMVEVANTYYKSTAGDWMLLELDCQLLYSLGIPILAQLAPESTKDQPVKCLQIFSGISTTIPGLVVNMYRMKRSSVDGRFLRVVPMEENEMMMNQSNNSRSSNNNSNNKKLDSIEVSQDKKKKKNQPQEESSSTNDTKGRKSLFGRFSRNK